jgi:hypothetical protein
MKTHSFNIGIQFYRSLNNKKLLRKQIFQSILCTPEKIKTSVPEHVDKI